MVRMRISMVPSDSAMRAAISAGAGLGRWARTRWLYSSPVPSICSRTMGMVSVALRAGFTVTWVPARRLRSNNPFGQMLQRVVHAGAGGAELYRQLGLVGNAVALTPFAVHDAAADFVDDGLSL